MSLNRNQIAFVKAAEEMFDKGCVLTRDNIEHVCEENDLSFPYWLVTKSEYRYGRGRYKLPDIGTKPMNREVAPEPELQVAMAAQVVALRQPKLVDESDPSVPERFPDYVPFGFYQDLLNIVRSKEFYPVFITGLSGNGKTMMAEQVCAALKRECIRVNISIETDESDLLGGLPIVTGKQIGRAHV